MEGAAAAAAAAAATTTTAATGVGVGIGGGASSGAGAGGVPCSFFQMPLHYPRYTQKDYQSMSESDLDLLFGIYGLPPINGDVEQKRKYAIGVFLWPCQCT